MFFTEGDDDVMTSHRKQVGGVKFSEKQEANEYTKKKKNSQSEPKDGNKK